ncbi:hypothetical protein B9Z51_03200 [Limnohabitans sp. T6-5]|uniref:FRG domain-containing protein n=1 Tax=Limnohabitans sp. T6-5 TaxID=1100724 RepID=UPI000D36CD78|nr:FRG domain-containing protein [Limnohabitans sp. T6-5]PUE11328.1 hypothetical protein B9Z51_03200 [Limnohabitans sp. T6-5]
MTASIPSAPFTWTKQLETAANLIETLSNPQQFANKFFPNNCLSQSSIYPQWVFRGVGNSNYRLTPTSLRTKTEDSNTYALLKSYGLKESNCSTKTFDSNNQKRVELEIICEFYKRAHRAGLALPRLSYTLHQYLLESNVSELMHIQHGSMTWPDHELLPIFGIAQHYGVPTRLLDWSHSPFVAAFFAAQSAAKENKKIETSKLAVWILNSKFLQHNNASGVPREVLHIIEPPTSDNPNLSLQQGVFTLQSYENDNQEFDLSKYLIDSLVKYHINLHIPILLKLELPASQSRDLLQQLSAIGYSANRIYNGFEGAAKSVWLR